MINQDVWVRVRASRVRVSRVRVRIRSAIRFIMMKLELGCKEVQSS